jgi:hypothetical protein
MIFRLTQKMAKKIGVEGMTYVPPEGDAFLDWCAQLFTARRVQYIMLVNTKSLFTTLMYGRGVTEKDGFIKGVFGHMAAELPGSLIRPAYERFIEPDSGPIVFSKVGDRRVLGSMNDMAYRASGHIIEQGCRPDAAAFLLNRAPMGQLKMETPADVFEEMMRGRLRSGV